MNLAECLEAICQVVGKGTYRDEPSAGHGPFGMNIPAGIVQGVSGFSSGRFGRIMA